VDFTDKSQSLSYSQLINKEIPYSLQFQVAESMMSTRDTYLEQG